MGNQQPSNCVKCVECSTCENCPTCPTQRVFQCDTTLIEKNYRDNRRNNIENFNADKKEKESVQDVLVDDIATLGMQMFNNANILDGLRVDLKSAGKYVGQNYVDDMNTCLQEGEHAKADSEKCLGDKMPVLGDRNVRCKDLRVTVNKLIDLNGKGWSQCACPNGVLKNENGMCPDGKASCTSCDTGYWKRTSQKCEIKEFSMGKDFTKDFTWQDANDYCASKDMRLCPYDEICPNGANQSPQGGFDEADTWMPIENDTWISTGKLWGNEMYCNTYDYFFGVSEPQWDDGHQKREKLLCCPDPQECQYEKCESVSGCPEGFRVTKAATSYSDAECAQNICTCSNGLAKTGKSCLDHGTEQCASCNNGYYLWDKECKQKKCTCSNGTGSTGTACPSNGEAYCASCNSGYHLTGGNCELKRCTCSNGTAATGTSCPTHNSAKCTRCNNGYTLTGVQCKQKVNCKWSEWNAWSECTDCYKGTQTSTRYKATTAKNGGRDCSGENSKTQSCSPGCQAFETACYSHDSSGCKGDRDKCIKNECKSRGLTWNENYTECKYNFVDWYKTVKGNCD